MDDITEKFLEDTLNEIEEMYNNDEFRDGYAEAVELLKNSIIRFYEDIKPELDCKVLEFDPDYDGVVDILENIGEEIKGRTIDNYFTTSWNNSYFIIFLLKKEANND